ncbi:YybH family protein [Thermodesulfobacteriota bacterium]
MTGERYLKIEFINYWRHFSKILNRNRFSSLMSLSKKHLIKTLIIMLISVPTVAVAEASVARDIGIIRDRIEAWRKAWESKNIDRYMSFYSPSFISQNINYAEWKNRKIKIFNTPGDISLQIIDLWVLKERNYASVSFLQYYKGPLKSDAGIKSMVLKRTGEHWLIISETWEPMQRPTNASKSPQSTINSKEDDKSSDATTPIPMRGLADETASDVKVNRIRYQTNGNQEEVVIELNRHSSPEFFRLESESPRYVIDVRDVFSWTGVDRRFKLNCCA